MEEVEEEKMAAAYLMEFKFETCDLTWAIGEKTLIDIFFLIFGLRAYSVDNPARLLPIYR